MTLRRFFLLAAVLAWFGRDGARGQTTIAASQVVCPVGAVPVVTIALPPGTPGGTKKMQLSCIALDPKSFVIDTTTTPATIKAVGSNLVEGEKPIGAIDGINLTFTLPTAAPAPAASLKLYRNGIRLSVTTDYTVTGKIVSFVLGAQPQAGDTLIADYRF